MKKFSAIKVFLLAGLLAAALCVPALAADDTTLVQVGDETVTVDELRYILSQHTDGNEAAAGAMMAQMSSDEKVEFLKQIADALLLAREAQRTGVQLEPAVAYKLRWDSVNTLAQAYLGKISTGWDMSPEKMKAWYEAHKEDYVSEDSVKVRHILVPTEEEARSIMVRLLAGDDFAEVARKQSKDFASARQGGEIGWVKKGQTVPGFEEAVFSAKKDKVGGPVKTEFGYHVFEVTDRREARQLTMSEAVQQVARDLQNDYIQNEVQRLRDRNEVTIDEEEINKLGK